MDKSLLAGLGVGTALVFAGFAGSAVLFPPAPREPVVQETEAEPVAIVEPAAEAVAPEPEPELEPVPDAVVDSASVAENAADRVPEPATERDAAPDGEVIAVAPELVSPEAAPPEAAPEVVAQEDAPGAMMVAEDPLPLSPEPDAPAATTRLPSGILPTPRSEGVLALPQVLPPVPDAPETSAISPPPEDALANAPALGAQPEALMPGMRISGLPQIRGAEQPATRAGDVLRPGDAVVTALERNSLYAGKDDTARMAVILADPGLPMSMRQALGALDMPLTIALNPLDSSAREAADLYRDAGKEVVILATSIPEGATASDLDVTFNAFFAAVPTAVGVIDLPESGFARNVGLLGQILPLLAQDGYGLLTFSGGLAQSARAAQTAGIAHAEVFRSLDTGNESAFTIRRFLDRAVFQASQTGQVVVFGDASNAATMEALEMWIAGGPPDQVAVVPVSGILLNAR